MDHNASTSPPSPQQPAPPPSLASSPSSSSKSSSNKGTQGIDIQDALSILSHRAQQGTNKEVLLQEKKIDLESFKQMGQTIDFMTSSSSSSSSAQHENENGNVVVTATSQEQMTKDGNNEKANHHDGTNSSQTTNQKLKQTLAQKSPSELLQALFQLQQQRVATYQKFNQSLETTLQSKNFTNYTTTTTNITASFVVISNSIKEIQSLFSMNHSDLSTGKDIGDFIKALQSYEKEKLQLTAALHLERMREGNDDIDFSIGEREVGRRGREFSGNSGNEKIASLVRESIVSLQGKIAECIENINDVMEELRYAADDL